ncbi:hypothetical protein RB599_010252 [Gaeumannomyces hyphopodioides]
MLPRAFSFIFTARLHIPLPPNSPLCFQHHHRIPPRAKMAASLFVPGLNTGLKDGDYEKSRQVYNNLVDDTKLDDDSGRVIEQHLPHLLHLLDRHNLLELFGFHSAHNHYRLDPDTAQFGTDDEVPIYRRTKPTPVEDLRKREVHGHIFVVTDTGLQPYEFQNGKGPDFSHCNLRQFLQEFIEYIQQNRLQESIGLQVRYKDLDRPETWECFEGKASVMVDGTVAADLGYKRGRTTGWVGRKQDGQVESTGVEMHVVIDGKVQCYRDKAV